MSLRRKTLLVLSEDPLTRWALGQALGQEYQALAAETGRGALRLFKGRPPPDLVLIDVPLPAQHTLEFLSRVLAAWPDTRVLAMTASRSLRLMHEIRKRGAEYVSRPTLMGGIRATLPLLLRPPEA